MPAATLSAPVRLGDLDWNLASQLHGLGATYNEIAAQIGAPSGECVRKRLYRMQPRKVILPPAPKVVKMAIVRAKTGMDRASDRIREALSAELEQTAATLAKVKQKPTAKGLKARIELLEPLARTAKIVHDWGNSSTSGLVMVGGMPDIEPAIEVQAEPAALPEIQPEPPK